MQFTVNAKQFSDKLATVFQILPKRAINPILENVMLVAGNGVVFVSATNLETDITVSLEASVEVAGMCLVDGNRLKNIVKTTNKSIDFSFLLDVSDNDDKGILKLSDGTNKSTLPVASITDYPEFPEVANFDYKFNKDSFLEATKAVMHAVSNDQTKQILTTFNLQVHEDKATFATTDGHRLAVASFNCNESDESLGVNIPWSTFKYLEKIAKLAKKETEVFLGIESDELICLKIGNDKITTRLHQGMYPNYVNLIPKQFEITVQLAVKPWIEAVKYLKSFIPNDKYVYGVPIKMHFDADNKTCTLTVTIDKDQIFEKVISNVDLKSATNHFEIGFSPNYFLNALEAMTSNTVELNMNKNTSPAIMKPIKSETDKNKLLIDLTLLLMPVQSRE